MTVTNLVGPPGSGKSTLARMLVERHPGLAHVAIDDFRRTYVKERVAWRKLARQIRHSGRVIVESSGLSWRLKDVLPDRFKSVILDADRDELLRRVRHREVVDIPFEHEVEMTEMIDNCIGNLRDMYAGAAIVDTGGSVEEAYRRLESVII